MTINEAMIWQKTLQARHAELVALRNQNSYRVRQFRGIGADKESVQEPTYDVKALDRLVDRIAREMRKLDSALKATNAITAVIGYDADESALGTIE